MIPDSLYRRALRKAASKDSEVHKTADEDCHPDRNLKRFAQPQSKHANANADFEQAHRYTIHKDREVLILQILSDMLWRFGECVIERLALAVLYLLERKCFTNPSRHLSSMSKVN